MSRTHSVVSPRASQTTQNSSCILTDSSERFYFYKHGTSQYVRVPWRTLYHDKLVCTNWTTLSFSRELESILMLGYHYIPVPHTQYHFPRSKVKEISLHIVSGKLGLDQYIPAWVCTSDEQVHTHNDLRKHAFWVPVLNRLWVPHIQRAGCE